MESRGESVMENKTHTFGRFLKTLGTGMLRFIVPFILTARAAGMIFLNERWSYLSGEGFLTVFGITTSIQITHRLVDMTQYCAVGLYAGAAIAALVQLLTERKWKRWISICLQFVLGFGMAFGIGILLSFENVVSDYTACATIGLVVAAILFGLAVACKRGAEGAGARSAASGVIVGGAVGVVLMAALLLFALAVDELLTPVDYEVYLLLVLFSLGSVAVTVFLSFLPRPDAEQPQNKAYTIAFSYVLLPLYLVLITILYAYLAVILVRFTLPSGQLNPFGLIALAGFLVLWFALKGEDNRLARWFTRWGGLLLLPITAAQIIALWVRIDAYGLTPNRVVSVIAVLLGLIAIVLCTCRRKLSVFCTVAGVLALLVTLTPLNPLTLSNISQERRLKDVLTQYGLLDADNSLMLPDNALPDADYDRVREGLSYFRGASGVTSSFGRTVAKNASSFLSSYREKFMAGAKSAPQHYENVILYSLQEDGPLPIGDAKRVYLIRPIDPYRYNADEAFVWTDPQTGEQVFVDLSALIEELRVYSKDSGKWTSYGSGLSLLTFSATMEQMRVPIDDTHTLLLTSFCIYEEMDGDECSLTYDEPTGLMLVR